MIRVGSLCTGYGGLDMGLALALGQPIEHAWFVEYDGQNRKGELTGPKRLLAYRYPDVHNYGDVKTTDWHEVPHVDWLTAGYPCQPFSGAGLRKGADDPRHLWPGVARAISVLRPPNVLLENVRGHVSLGLDAVLGDLAALGYDARWGVVRAADAGAPHNRERIFIVAADASGERHGRRQDGRTLGRVDGRVEGFARERERPRPEPGDRGAQAAPDAGSGPLTRPAAAGDGLRLVAERGDDHAADAESHGPADESARRDYGLPPVRSLLGAGDGDCGGADAQGGDFLGGGAALVEAAWGAYEPAIRRWERISGRPAPRPTEPARTGERLSPRFVEWMMGLPAGWVTDVPGLPRNAQLKLLGNGVVPQQAALALRLLNVTNQEAAA